MSSVDNRIVQMTFDNKQFESGVQTSLNTLGKLNDALNFSDRSGISNLASSLESLNNKFSTLGIIGANVVSRLTQEFMNNLLPIINSVASTIGSLTVNFETLSQSFGKYEQMVANQQTIMSSVGDKINEITGELYSMEDVAEIIDRLRWYTDETSYNLDQMVSAIGDFTASGIDLGESEKMILGIANACADAGITADKADIAMRGFSRAIGSGAITLQTWNTMLKTSGITNSERFRQSLLDAAEAEGTLIRVGDKLMTLDKKKEVTTATLTDTLTEYAWAVENKEHHVLSRLLSEYSNTVNGIYALTHGGQINLSVEAFNDLTKAIEEQGKSLEELGLDQEYDLASDAIEALTNAYIDLGLEVPKSLKAFTRAQEAVSLTQAIEATATAVRSQWARTFELIFGNYEEAKKLWTGVANSMWGIFAGGGDFRNDILDFWHDDYYENFANGIVKAFEIVETATDNLRERFKSLFTVPDEFKTLEEYLGNRLGKITNKFSSWMDLIGAIDLFDYAKTWGQLPPILEKTGKSFNYVYQEMSDFANLDRNHGVIQDLVEKFGSLEEVLRRFKIIDNIKKTFNGFISLLDLGRQIVDGFWRATEPLRELLGKIAEKMLDASGSMGDWIKNLSESTKQSDFFYNVFKKLVDIIMGFGIPAFELLSNVFKKIKEFLAPLSKLFEDTKNAVKEFLSSISDKNMERIQKFSDFFKVIGDILGSVLDKIISAAKKIHQAFKEIFGDVSLKDIGEIINTFLKGGILAKILSMLNHTAYDLGSVTESIQDVLYTFSQNFSAFFSETKIKAKNILIFAAGILVFAVALKTIASIDGDKLANATLGMGILFGEIAGAIYLLKLIDNPNFKKQVKGLITFAASLLILSIALNKIGKMDWDQIKKGVVGLGIIMAELVIASRYMKRMTVNPTGLLALSAAMLIFALDMKIIGGMEWGEIAKGVVGIGAILLELAGFFAIMNKFGGGPIKLLASAVAITTISAAMLVFTGVLKILGAMDNERLAKGLIAIGVALLEFAVAAAFMKDALPAAASILLISSAMVVLSGALVVISLLKWSDIAKGLITLAGALGVMVAAAYLLKGSEVTLLAFAASITLIGVGIAALAIGIETLVIALSTGSVLIVEAIALIISTIADMIPTIITKIGEGIIALITLIGNSSTALVGAVVQIIEACLIAINTLVPQIIETGINIILCLLKGIAENIYQIVILAGQIVTEFINGIIVILPEVVDSGVNLIVAFINGMANAIVEHADDLLDAVKRLMASVAYFILTVLDSLLSDIPFIGGKIHEKLEGIKNDLQASMSKEEGEKIGSNLTEGLASGINKGSSKAITAAGNVATNALKKAKEVLKIESPSKAFMEVGMFADEGLAQGFTKYSDDVDDAASSVATSALTTFADLVSDEIGLDPVITPVLDLSEIQNGAKNLNSMFGDRSIGTIGSFGNINEPSASEAGVYSPTVNVTIYASEGQSSDDLYNTFTRRLNNDVRRRSLVWDH